MVNPSVEVITDHHRSHVGSMCVARLRSTREETEKLGVVVHFALSRGHCMAFWLIVPPLQVAPSLACSVSSLSRSPGHQLPDRCDLRRRDLADYLLVWGDSISMLCRTCKAPVHSFTQPGYRRRASQQEDSCGASLVYWLFKRYWADAHSGAKYPLIESAFRDAWEASGKIGGDTENISMAPAPG